jgi:hypothetical protein
MGTLIQISELDTVEDKRAGRQVEEICECDLLQE